MNSIDSDFGDDNYDVVLSNHGWDDTAQINMAQIDDIKNHLNFTDPNDMFEFAIHGIDLPGVNSDYIRNFCHEINKIANDFHNNRVPFDKTRACLICDKTGHDFTGCPYLQDNKKIKEAYICHRMAISKFLTLVKKINGTPKNIS